MVLGVGLPKSLGFLLENNHPSVALPQRFVRSLQFVSFRGGKLSTERTSELAMSLER